MFSIDWSNVPRHVRMFVPFVFTVCEEMASTDHIQAALECPEVLAPLVAEAKRDAEGVDRANPYREVQMCGFSLGFGNIGGQHVEIP